MNIETLLADHQLFHSSFQMDHFITAKAGGPTAYGQYKQALRELHKRTQALRQLRTQLKLLVLDMNELQMFPEDERNKVQLEQKQMEMEDAQRTVEDTLREFEHFKKQAEALKILVGKLTPERRNVLERRMWFETVKARIAFDFLTNGRVTRETFDLLLSCPIEWRRLIDDSNHKPLMNWFMNLSPLALECKDEAGETKELPAITGG